MPVRIAHLRRIVTALALGAASGLAPGAVRGAGCPCGTVADEFRAADAGLVREWIVQVPIGAGAEGLAHVVVGDGLAVVQSGDGGVHAIRATDKTAARAGTVAWSRPIAAAAGHAWPATIGTRLVVVASESAVHALDRETGDVKWERPTDTLTRAAAMQSGGWVYVPLQTNRILRLPANPLGKPEVPEVPAERPSARRRGSKPAPPPPPESLDPVSIDAGGHVDSAPLPLEAGVLWSTSSGLVALERTTTGWVRQQFPRTTPPTWVGQPPLMLAGPTVVRAESIFLATVGGGLARIDLNAPSRPGLRAVWTITMPDRATSGPFVSGDVVVVSLGPTGVAAFAATDGHELWRTDLAGTLVAVAGGRVWMLDEVGRLTALDLATGSRRQSACLGCFTLPVVNPLTERLVLASPGGVVVSLAPPPAPAPTVPAPPTPASPVTAADRPAAAPAPADPDATPP